MTCTFCSIDTKLREIDLRFSPLAADRATESSRAFRCEVQNGLRNPSPVARPGPRSSIDSKAIGPTPNVHLATYGVAVAVNTRCSMFLKLSPLLKLAVNHTYRRSPIRLARDREYAKHSSPCRTGASEPISEGDPGCVCDQVRSG